MAVSWVAGTAPEHAIGTSLAASAPAGIADFDCLFAAVFATSAISAPSGWTQKATTGTFTDTTDAVPRRLELWQKNSVTTSDASASFTWSQVDFDSMAVAYAVTRGTALVDATSTATEDSSTDWSITIPTVSGTDTGQMLLAIAANADSGYSGGDTRAPTPPSGTTLGTGTSSEFYRVAIAYRTANTSDSISGAFALHNTGSPIDPIGLGAISVRLSASGGTPSGTIVLSGPLGAPAVLGQQVAAKIDVPGPLGAVAVKAWHDPTVGIDAGVPTRYRMQLITSGGDVEAPISSWQATLQVDAAQYVQCVVPNPGELVDTIEDATHFRLTRELQLLGGGTVEFVIAEAPVQTVNYARGSTNYSATISGYLDAVPAVDWPEDTARTLTGIRAIFTTATTMRVSCSIDWLLSPGQPAIADGAPMTASYINYTVSDGYSQMDVGQRAEAP